MEANSTQVGGTHYQRDYQHWDFVADTNMPYHLGCATKYVSRWLEKNGMQDLEKSTHYIIKCQERGIVMPPHDKCHVNVFCKQLRPEDAAVIQAICNNEFNDAITAMEEMIAEATKNYVDQDTNYIRG